VVTKSGAIPVASATTGTTKPDNKLAPDWDWTGHAWQGPGGCAVAGKVGPAERRPASTPRSFPSADSSGGPRGRRALASQARVCSDGAVSRDG
jgi:hypothetical protein